MSPYKKYAKRPYDYRPMYRRLMANGATALVRVNPGMGRPRYALKEGVITALVLHLRNSNKYDHV